MSARELKPCPFCGGDATQDIYSGNPTIFCSACPALMGGEESNETFEELAAAWNRRALDPETLEAAAKVADREESFFSGRYELSYQKESDYVRDRLAARANVASNIAASIRALNSPKDSGGEG